MGANFANDRGVRPMHMACQSGDMALVQRLLELGETSRPRVIDEGGINNNCNWPSVMGNLHPLDSLRTFVYTVAFWCPLRSGMTRVYNVCYLDKVVFRLNIPFVKAYKTYDHLYQ